MSIVKGANGNLTVSQDLLPNYNHTVLIWVKDVSSAYAPYLTYRNNAAGDYISLLSDGSGFFQATVNQQFGNSASEGATHATATWLPVISFGNSSSPSANLETSAGEVNGGGSVGAYQTVSSPNLTIFDSSLVPNGTKIGCVAVWNEELSPGDRDAVIAGGNPADYGTLAALWVDNAGVSADGSNNLISWTDVISSYVLTPSNTVTVDGADLAPHGYSAGGGTPTPVFQHHYNLMRNK